MKALYVIPARGGSKGIPHKNLKPLGGKPLVRYSIDLARELADDADICLSTDDADIIRVAEEAGLKVPFVRPAELAGDHSGTYEVLLHALDHYQKAGRAYDTLVLLQPTSPFRQVCDVRACIEKYEAGDYQMVVSVREAESNPYYNCYEADGEGLLHLSKGDGSYVRRQDAPKAYAYNGAVYVMRVGDLLRMSYARFTRIGFVEMDAYHSLDLDTPLDWLLAETLLTQNNGQL